MPVGVRRTLGDARLQRAEVDAVRIRLELREREAVGVGAETVAVRAGAQHEVEHALGTAPRRERLRAARRRRDLRRCEPLRRDRLLHEPGDHEVVERVDVGVRALARRSRRRAAASICHSGTSPGSSSTSGGE